MKEQIKTPEKELSDEEIANLLVQDTGNQDARRTDWTWLQNEGRNESYPKWNKAKYTGNQQWREGKQDSNNLEQINIQLEQNEETRIQKKWGEA